MFENKEYHYPELNKLIDTTTIDDLSNINEMKIICFHVNNKGKYPFFQFLLYNYLSGIPLVGKMDYEFGFPKIQKEDFPCVAEYIKFGLMQMSSQIVIRNDNDIEIKGYYNRNNVCYVFVDISKINLESQFLEKNSEFWMVLLSEIINTKSVCNIKINDEAVDFFIHYYRNFTLENPIEKTMYSHPDVVYEGSHFKAVEFRDMFGISKKDDIYGNQYYITYCIENAFRDGGWSKSFLPETKHDKLITDNSYGRYIQGGINRIAVLTDKIIYLSPLSEIEKTEEYIDGLFKNYDTIYIEIPEKSFILIRDYDQQIPLSYHKINKISLKESWDLMNEYSIL
jgi:hypothetical protein